MGIELKRENVRALLKPGQKLTLADIRRTAPDSIRIIHFAGDLKPEPFFGFILVKNSWHIHYRDEELALGAQGLAILKAVFEVEEVTWEATPKPAAV